jgi:ammonium transporter Rh
VIGDFAAATVLISYGAVIGKVSPAQLIVMTVLELVFYGLNEGLAVSELGYADAGGSILIHIFGAYFGLTVSKMMTSKVRSILNK